MRLLLATAHLDLRLSLELLLSEQPGVEIVGAASECDGLVALTRTTKPDIIVTDWELPGRPLSPIIAAAHLFSPPPLTMVLLSENSSYQEAIESGADAVVEKGASPDVLLTTFQKLQRQFTRNQERTRYGLEQWTRPVL